MGEVCVCMCMCVRVCACEYACDDGGEYKTQCVSVGKCLSVFMRSGCGGE